MDRLRDTTIPLLLQRRPMGSTPRHPGPTRLLPGTIPRLRSHTRHLPVMRRIRTIHPQRRVPTGRRLDLPRVPMMKAPTIGIGQMKDADPTRLSGASIGNCWNGSLIRRGPLTIAICWPAGPPKIRSAKISAKA